MGPDVLRKWVEDTILLLAGEPVRVLGLRALELAEPVTQPYLTVGPWLADQVPYAEEGWPVR